MPTIIGIDPSLRHSGLCVLSGTGPYFYEVKTEDLSVQGASDLLRKQLADILDREVQDRFAVVGIERQLPTSGALFYAMMTIIEVLVDYENPLRRWLVMPLPVQLKSYMQKQLGLSTVSKGTVVTGVQTILDNPPGRLSSHKADAYCVARMAKDVSEGKWNVRLPSKETHLVPPEWVFGEK